MPSELEPPARKGRGATFNPKVRFESGARDPFDDGWGSLAEAQAEAPAPPTEVIADQQPHGDRAQPLARHPVRAVDQPLPRLRAWLHLLLCAPEPRLSRALARARFRDQAARQTRRGGAARARARPPRLSLPADRARHQHRSLPADRAAARHHARDHRGVGAVPPSADDRHQVGGGDRAISTCSRRWRRTAWHGSRFR